LIFLFDPDDLIDPTSVAASFAARMPGILFAAIEAPIPVQARIPLAPLFARTLKATFSAYSG
jgi:hypothetical protein